MMTDQKRASLISVGLGKKEKKSKSDELTTRLNLTITPNNGEEFASFNYQTLISKAKPRKESKTNGVGPLDAFADNDDDQLKNLAKTFESKYGTPEKKKYGRFVNYNELGEGYDESDSFIDNSEAFDEVVPDNQTTAYGGFYINVGKLEMKTIPGGATDDASDSDGNIGGVRKGTKRPLESGSEEDSDDDEDDDDEDSSSTDMEDNAGQTNASDSEESAEDAEDAKTANGEANGDANGQVAKKAKVQSDAKEGPQLKKKKRKVSGTERKSSDSEMPVLKREEQDSSTGGESRRPSTNSEVVDSAGGEGHNDDSGSSGSKSISGSGESSDTEDSGEASDSPKAELAPPPPEKSNLPEDVRGLLRLIHGIVTKDPAAKIKFSPEINKSLLRFEMKCQELPAPVHGEAYNQLGMILSCSPKKLARKALDVFKSHIESSITTKLQSLKTAVNIQMPTCLDRYNGDCERLAASERNPDDKAKRPRRRFRWTNEMRGMVFELTNLRRKLYKLQTSADGVSEDDDVRAFLTQLVCPLWPAGWMKVVALMDVKPPQSCESPAASGAPSAASKPKKSLPVQRKSAPKAANASSNPVLVPVNMQQMSVPVCSPMRTEQQPPVNVMKKPSPPKAPTTNLPPSIGKISVPQGTDITPVNLSSAKQNPVNGSNRQAQITVKPVFNPSSQYPRDDAQHKQKGGKASDPVTSRTLHAKSDVHQEMGVGELEIVPAAGDASLSTRASPLTGKVGMASPEAHHLGSWKTQSRPAETRSSPQWRVKDEPSGVHETRSTSEDDVLILDDFSSPPSSNKRPVVIEVMSHRPKPGDGDQTSQVKESLDRLHNANLQSVTNGGQGRDEMTITVNSLEAQSQQATARLEEKLRNSYEDQSSQDFRMNVVQNLLNAEVLRQMTDMLEVDRSPQSSHTPQLKAGGGASLRAD